MSGRGRERLVRCEKCGRQVRRDKAVFIDKVMFSNPLDPNQVEDENYRRVITREVCYCASCGKHGRIFEKKKRQVQQRKERSEAREASGHRPSGQSFTPRPYTGPRQLPVVPAPSSPASGSQPSKPQ